MVAQHKAERMSSGPPVKRRGALARRPGLPPTAKVLRNVFRVHILEQQLHVVAWGHLKASAAQRELAVWAKLRRHGPIACGTAGRRSAAHCDALFRCIDKQ